MASVSDALQGRLAGVVVSSSSGRPGSNSEIIIHGYNNFQAVQRGENTHEPLYIMDGVAVSSSVMSDFNPNDIETITVLKRCCFYFCLWSTCCQWGYIDYHQKKDVATNVQVSRLVISLVFQHLLVPVVNS